MNLVDEDTVLFQFLLFWEKILRNFQKSATIPIFFLTSGKNAEYGINFSGAKSNDLESIDQRVEIIDIIFRVQLNLHGVLSLCQIEILVRTQQTVFGFLRVRQPGEQFIKHVEIPF